MILSFSGKCLYVSMCVSGAKIGPLFWLITIACISSEVNILGFETEHFHIFFAPKESSVMLRPDYPGSISNAANLMQSSI